jgi:hyperosmotically inducible protein
MNARFAMWCVAGALLVPVTAHTAEFKDPSSTARPGTRAGDAAMAGKIKAQFDKDKQIHAMEIKVDADGGVVTLTGHAKSKAEADKAVSIARSTPGVTEVKNMIQVSVLDNK